MTPSWIDSLLSARVYDLEQPRFAGMPIHPAHRPRYFCTLHDLRPHLERWTRTLFFNGRVVKRFARPAPNVEAIFDAVEQQNWAQRIKNPFPTVRSRDRKRHLHETIQNINRRLDHRLLVFRGDGTGRGILWQPA
jgi:hypothetical protein